MENIFTPKENTKVKKNDIIVKCINASRFGIQGLSSLGPKIWNNLPSNVKSEISFLNLRNILKLGLDRSADARYASACEHKMFFCFVYIQIYQVLHIFILTWTF